MRCSQEVEHPRAPRPWRSEHPHERPLDCDTARSPKCPCHPRPVDQPRPAGQATCVHDSPLTSGAPDEPIEAPAAGTSSRLITRAGTPATIVYGSTSCVTKLFGATMAPSPTVTPPKI